MDHRQHLPKAAAAEKVEVIEEVVELVETGITAKRFSARLTKALTTTTPLRALRRNPRAGRGGWAW